MHAVKPQALRRSRSFHPRLRLRILDPRDPGHPGASAAEPEGAVAAGGGLQPPGLLGCPASFSGWA